MASDAGQIKELYYSSDPDLGVVHVYDYQTGKLVGKLGNFFYPEGQCVAANGNVFVTNQGDAQVNEYVHGRFRPVKTFNAGGAATACSVSPNGDLAVANLHAGGNQGDIVIFHGAKGNGKAFLSSTCYLPGPISYDGKGNLYVTGESHHARPAMCELPSDGTKLRAVKSGIKSSHYPAGIMWDGKHITLSYNGFGRTTIYQMKESPDGDLTKIGQVALGSASCVDSATVVPLFVGKKNTPDNHELATEVVGNSWECRKNYVWRYPGSAGPYRAFRGQKDDAATGQAVSIDE